MPSVGTCWHISDSSVKGDFSLTEHRHVPLHVKLRGKVCDLIASLKSCGRSRDLEEGRRLHRQATHCGLEHNMYVASSLIDMYAKCASMADARSIFDGMPRPPDVVLWNALLWGYATNGEGEMVLLLLEAMHAKHHCYLLPDAQTFTAALKACASLATQEEGSQPGGVKMVSLEKAMFVASRASRVCKDDDRLISNTLISVYGKCGSPVDSHMVFDSLLRPDVVSWTALILSYADSGDGQSALTLFQHMQADGSCPPPNGRTFVAVLKSCANCLAANEEATLIDGRLVKVAVLEVGMAVHARLLLVLSSKPDRYVVSSLMDMYVKCGSFADACLVFGAAWCRREVDLVSWTVLVLGYAAEGKAGAALECFELMTRCAGCDAMALAAALRACASAAAATVEPAADKLRGLETGMALHAHARQRGCEGDKVVANALVDMYAKCSNMVDAQMVFDRMRQPDPNAWTSLILGYVDNGMADLALESFASMSATLEPGLATYTAAFKACSSLAAAKVDSRDLATLEKGMALHAHAASRHNLDACHTAVSNSLVDMYAKCGSTEDASRVFFTMRPDVVSCNALMSGAANSGMPRVALHCFELMLQEQIADGCQPDAWTFAAAFKALACLAEGEQGSGISETGSPGGKLVVAKLVSLERCMAVHAHLTATLADTVVANALLDAYSKCGSVADMRRVFDSIECHNEVSWNSLIRGCAANGEPEFALALSRQRDCKASGSGIRACAAALSACAGVGDSVAAKAIHARLCRYHDHSDVSSDGGIIVTCLVTAYAKCGRMADAQHVFDSAAIDSIDTAGWNALISGYGRSGHVSAASALFDLLEENGRPQPDGVTFLCLLTACSHGGFVDSARHYFQVMRAKYGACATIEHYHCVIDMLGRVNQLDAAVEVLEAMPFEPNTVTWTLLLDASSRWRCARVGCAALKSLVSLGLETEASSYVLSANMNTS